MGLKIKNIISALFVTCLFASSAHAWKELEGGDEFESSFKSSVGAMLMQLWEVPAYTQEALRLQKVLEMSVIAPSEESLYLRGVEKSAITELEYDDQTRVLIGVKIMISLKKWKAMTADEQMSLAVHELLHATPRGDRGYYNSGSLIRDLNHYKQIKKSHGDLYSYLLEDFRQCKLDRLSETILLIWQESFAANLNRNVSDSPEYCPLVKEKVREFSDFVKGDL